MAWSHVVSDIRLALILVTVLQADSEASIFGKAAEVPCSLAAS